MSMGFKRPKVRHLTRWVQDLDNPPCTVMRNVCGKPTRQQTGKSWPDECMTDAFFLSLPHCPACDAALIHTLEDGSGEDSWAFEVKPVEVVEVNVKITLNSYLNYGEGLGV